MTSDVPVRCKCGALRGVARAVSPKTANRSLCYCHDCRAFAHWLGREDLVDARGAVEIVQVARARLEISDGLERVRCLRLSDKGMHRWYADCCKTPLGNTIPRIPFIGVARATLEIPLERSDEMLGAILVAHVGSAVGGARRGEGMSVRSALHITRLLASWTLRGLGHPTPLFSRENRPTVTPQILTAAEREALRQHPRA
jgi:hypothetical protein